MNDSWGRRIGYLRVSLTHACQLRCLYCRGPGGPSPIEEPLASTELLRLAAGVAEACGIRKVRLTGGEPLVHPDVVDFAARLRRVPGVRYLGLTTNGLLLPEMAEPLRRAGVDGVNVSLDSLRPGVYRRLTGGGSLSQALAGLEAAREHDWQVKINTVLVRGINDCEILDFLRFVEGASIELRFIEVMPAVGVGRLVRGRLVPSDEVRSVIESAYRLEPLPRRPGAPAQTFRASRNGRAATVGFISSVTHRFCGDCNRLRLTADGSLVTCLWSGSATDLRPHVRPHLRPGALRDAVRRAVASKAFRPPMAAGRDMVAIGG
ncbi:MAG: GTP 3',8-cyclase MoaA [Armatimonadota bacterium]